MATIKQHAHATLADFVKDVITKAKAGDFIDGAKLARAHYGNRPLGSYPGVDLVTSKTKPTGSGKVATTGDLLYAAPFPQRFGIWLNDIQIAVATGGGQAGRDFAGLILTSHRTKPLFRCNVKFTGSAAPAPVITAKTAPANFRVGDADLAATALFDIAPSGTAMTLATDADTFGKIVAGKLHAVAPGDVVVTASAAGAADATLTVTVKAAAPAAKTVNGKALDAQVGGTVVPAASLFTIANGAAYSDILTVTGTPDKVTWDAAASTLTIADDATGDIALAYTLKAGVTKGTTAARLTGVTAKP